ncbi:MAG: hypothetical protein IPM77_15490 [Crocinitomicaceae bacterium]|nr:hypothetical protein [Crocinitomicaceae bacterium]
MNNILFKNSFAKLSNNPLPIYMHFSSIVVSIFIVLLIPSCSDKPKPDELAGTFQCTSHKVYSGNGTVYTDTTFQETITIEADKKYLTIHYTPLYNPKEWTFHVDSLDDNGYFSKQYGSCYIILTPDSLKFHEYSGDFLGATDFTTIGVKIE